MANRLRTILSLLGITIGIWCVVLVLSAVDSLADTLKNSFQKLGNDVVYMSVIPWDKPMTPEEFERYLRRPFPNYNDYHAITDRVTTAQMASYSALIGTKTLQYRSVSASNIFVVGVTDKYPDIFGLEFAYGRSFNTSEYERGDDKIIIGYEVAKALFGEGVDPTGIPIRVLGRKMEVLGVLKKEGKSLINPINFDQVALIGYHTVRKFLNLDKIKGGGVNVKAMPGVPLEQLKSDVEWVVRANRHTKPREESSFALNSLSIITNALDSFFAIVRWAGLFIGFFSLLVGAFSVANIMFVSVKERTGIIGIKMALGAPRVVILTEFLLESVILSLLGGMFGLLLVYAATFFASYYFEYTITLSLVNIAIGVVSSASIGIIAGIIPAYGASRMDPVEAIRS